MYKKVILFTTIQLSDRAFFVCAGVGGGCEILRGSQECLPNSWEFGIDMYTLLYLKQITNKDLLYSTGNSAQYSVIT